MAELLLRLRGREVSRTPIFHTRLTLGRDGDSDVVIDNPAVSRTHAILIYVDDQFRIRDADSQNGMTVNGAAVKDAVVKYGDVIGVGKFEVVLVDTGDELKLRAGAQRVGRSGEAHPSLPVRSAEVMGPTTIRVLDAPPEPELELGAEITGARPIAALSPVPLVPLQSRLVTEAIAILKVVAVILTLLLLTLAGAIFYLERTHARSSTASGTTTEARRLACAPMGVSCDSWVCDKQISIAGT